VVQEFWEGFDQDTLPGLYDRAEAAIAKAGGFGDPPPPAADPPAGDAPRAEDFLDVMGP
jgi:hypothetical protein